MRRTLLIDEYPILVLPTLAEKIGLEEAIVLQQLHYWINNPKVGRFIDGRRWIKNSMEQWQTDNFKFIHMKTLRRVFERLKRDGLILLRSDLNHSAFDRTFWYSIDYEKLSDRCGQIDQMGVDNLTISLTETTSETTENTNSESSKEDSVIVVPSPNPNQKPPEENPLSTPLTIPHEVIPIITPTITPAPTEEKPTIPTLQVEFSVLPERGSVSGISTDKPEVKPKRRAKKETKPKLALYSNKELFDILLAFSFPGSDPDAVMPLIGKLRKTLADYIYTKNKGEELTPERTERFLAKMRGLEGWYKANHKDDGYRPKFPNPFMATIGAYFGTPTQAENVLKERVKCPDCNGEGMKISRENLKPGQFYETIICATCNGAGKIYRG